MAIELHDTIQVIEPIIIGSSFPVTYYLSGRRVCAWKTSLFLSRSASNTIINHSIIDSFFRLYFNNNLEEEEIWAEEGVSWPALLGKQRPEQSKVEEEAQGDLGWSEVEIEIAYGGEIRYNEG